MRVIGNRDFKKLAFPLALFGVISGSAAAGALGAFKHVTPGKNAPAVAATATLQPVSGRTTHVAIDSFGPISIDDGVAVARAAALTALDARLEVLNSRELLALCAAVGSVGCGEMDRAGVIRLIHGYAGTLRRKELVAMCAGMGGCGAIPVESRIRVMRYQTPTARKLLAERELRVGGSEPSGLSLARRQDADTVSRPR